MKKEFVENETDIVVGGIDYAKTRFRSITGGNKGLRLEG